MLLHTFTTDRPEITIKVLLRIGRELSTAFDVMDSNGAALSGEPFTNIVDALSHAKRQVDLVNADGKNIMMTKVEAVKPSKNRREY